MSSGQDLWKKAIKVIPGGNGLLSKRPERYAPDIWPTYYSRSKGVHVWDLEGNKYVDMAQMGIGAAILGYADEEVDNAVRKIIGQGVSNTLNNPNEVFLAEKLLELNPFAGGVKFARSGGEAMAIAVRIARAHIGKDQIAFSGYHGWCDWYLAANIDNEENLSNHLLPGLEAKGVSGNLLNTIFPFEYNNLSELKELVENNDIGVIVMEGARYDFPTQDFIDGVCKISKENNIVLVVDEITSGWRMTDGGVFKLLNYTPDIVVYGKGMGNGYAINAIVGKKEVMSQAQETFISSTFWTEGVGFAAALKTLDILTKKEVWIHLNEMGNLIGKGWDKLATKYDLRLKTTDFKPLITFKLDYGDSNPALYTLFIQEMLKRGYLAANSVYLSYSHTKQIIDEYLISVDEVFSIMSEAIQSDKIENLLETSIKQESFKRLN